MKIDYKKELENTAKNMILVHEPDTLIKLIVRGIVQKVKVKHAGILLHYKDKDTYVLTVSRGSMGFKIPKGFARMDADNPLICLFRQRLHEKLFNDGALVYEKAKRLLAKNRRNDVTKLFKGALYQMDMFETVACIPSYFRNDLLGILLLGSKKNGKRFHRQELNFFSALASDVAMALKNAQLFRDLELELENRRQLFIHTTIALTAAIDAKDHYTHGHTERVTTLSLAIAQRINLSGKKGLSDKFLEQLHIASLLHDIGKIGIPESILNKEGPLDENETKKMREHPVVGAIILEPIKELEDAALAVKYHHEKYDGSGYPDGLRASSIPLTASIISVADAFDALTSDRPYRKKLSKEEAVEEIKKESGKGFDPQIVNALCQLYKENKI